MAALAAEADRAELERAAARWGLGRLWRTTGRVVDALLYGRRPHAPLALWTRGLASARDRTVAESHLERLTSGYWALPAGPAARALARAASDASCPRRARAPAERLRRAARGAGALAHPSVATTRRSGRRPAAAADGAEGSRGAGESPAGYPGGLLAVSDWQRPDSEPLRLDHDDAATLQSLRGGARFATRSVSCCSGRRSVPRRNRITDGRAEVRRASTVPKSVSADTTMRPSVAARSKISSSLARCMS